VVAVSSTFITGDQGVALVSAAPSAGQWAALIANPTIQQAFGVDPSFLAVGELGGGHSSSGSDTQTATSEIDIIADPSKLTTRGELVVGLYNATVVGGGFSSLTFDLYADGTDIVHESFSSVANAEAFFSDDALDLGSLATAPLGSTPLSLRAVMSVTGSSAGGGFDASLLFGNPAASSGVLSFAQAAAGMASSNGVGTRAPPVLVAPSEGVLAARA
jgi:hypothetical protein